MNHWLKVDFGTVKTFNELKLYFYMSESQTEYYLEDYKFQYNSGTVENPIWTDLISITGNTEQNPRYYFPKTTAQQVRLYITDPNTSNNDNIARLYEIEVFEVPDELISASAASADSQYDESHAASKAVDGDKSTYWRSNSQLGSHWLVVDFGQTETFDQIKVFMEEASMGVSEDFRLQYNSGTVESPIWTDIAAVLANDESVREFAFNPISAQQVRIYFTYSNSSNNGAANNEIEISQAGSYNVNAIQNDVIENETKGSHRWSNY